MLSRYTLKQLREDFPDDQACFDWLVSYLYPEGFLCVNCGTTPHYKIKGRRAFACGVCGHHLYPLAGTIFAHSRLPLTDWFHAIWMMSANKAGTSAMQIMRELGCTYNAAWRMMHAIRSMMTDEEPFEGEVEIDETFVHPNVYKRSSARKKYGFTGMRRGAVLFGITERGGRAKIVHVPTAGARVLRKQIKKDVKPGTLIHSDGYLAYRALPQMGYEHRWTDHSKREYYREDSYTQNIENLWSHLKRGIKGVYRHVDPNYLQLYANEYAWRYSHRHNKVLFWNLLEATAFLPFSSRPSSKYL